MATRKPRTPTPLPQKLETRCRQMRDKERKWRILWHGPHMIDLVVVLRMRVDAGVWPWGIWEMLIDQRREVDLLYVRLRDDSNVKVSKIKWRYGHPGDAIDRLPLGPTGLPVMNQTALIADPVDSQ